VEAATAVAFIVVSGFRSEQRRSGYAQTWMPSHIEQCCNGSLHTDGRSPQPTQKLVRWVGRSQEPAGYRLYCKAPANAATEPSLHLKDKCCMARFWRTAVGTFWRVFASVWYGCKCGPDASCLGLLPTDLEPENEIPNQLPASGREV